MRLVPRRLHSISSAVSCFNTSPHAKAELCIVAEEDAPSGMLARGHYTAVSTFIDDDKHKHLEFEWSFDIAKDW